MITLDIASLLSFVSFLFGSIAAVAAVVAVRSNQRLQARCEAVEASLASARREMEMVASISVRTGRRVKRIESEYSGVADRVDQVELRGPTQSFEQAIDSARRGVDPLTLSQQFGLSRGEADLVTRMHGHRKTA
jgi:hypothetical protein